MRPPEPYVGVPRSTTKREPRQYAAPVGVLELFGIEAGPSDDGPSTWSPGESFMNMVIMSVGLINGVRVVDRNLPAGDRNLLVTKRRAPAAHDIEAMGLDRLRRP